MLNYMVSLAIVGLSAAAYGWYVLAGAATALVYLLYFVWFIQN